MKKLDKEKWGKLLWGKLLKNKTSENHAEVMQKIGVSEEKDKAWHKEHSGEPTDFSKLKDNPCENCSKNCCE